MSIGKALRYPFQNPARLVFLALSQSLLVFTLPVASGGYLVRYFGTETLTAFVSAAVFIIFVVDVIWLHGYSVAVIRSVLNGEEAPPRAKIRRNLRMGCLPLFSTLVFAGPVLFISLAALSLLFVENPRSSSSVLTLLFFVIALFALVGLAVFARIVYVIGVASYAANGRRESLIDMAGNASIARRNLKSSLAHSFRQALLIALFGLLAYFVISVGTQLYPAPDAHLLQNMAAFNWTAVAALVLTLLHLLYWHASTHLHAQYALALGIERHGAK